MGRSPQWLKSLLNWACEEVSTMVKVAPLPTMGLYCKKLLAMAKFHPKKLFFTPTLFKKKKSQFGVPNS